MNIGESITLTNLAATAGLSRMYFAKQFRVSTGVRPHDLFCANAIERAQQLLGATSDTLVEIALSVGFQTQAHFTTVFKRIAATRHANFVGASQGRLTCLLQQAQFGDAVHISWRRPRAMYESIATIAWEESACLRAG